MFAISIHYKIAEIAFRERFALDQAQTEALQAALKKAGITEFVYLYTCNRCELYGVGDYEQALFALAQAASADMSVLRGKVMIFEGERAIRHVFYVASGMDSMVVGEDEILGQMRDAYTASAENGFTGYELNMVFQAAFTAAKKIKTDTLLSKTSVSVATLAASACHKFREGTKRVLLIGAGGEIGGKTLKNLISYGEFEITVTSRHKHGLPPENIHIAPYQDRYLLLGDADIVISATKSPHYTLTRAGIVDNHVPAKERLFIDLAVPRDIDTCVAELPMAKLITIDDFEEIARENNRTKEREADSAEEILRVQIDELKKEMLFHGFLPTLEKMKTHYADGFEKFVYQYRRFADAEGLQDFLSVLTRMEEERR